MVLRSVILFQITPPCTDFCTGGCCIFIAEILNTGRTTYEKRICQVFGRVFGGLDNHVGAVAAVRRGRRRHNGPVQRCYGTDRGFGMDVPKTGRTSAGQNDFLQTLRLLWRRRCQLSSLPLHGNRGNSRIKVFKHSPVQFFV